MFDFDLSVLSRCEHRSPAFSHMNIGLHQFTAVFTNTFTRKVHLVYGYSSLYIQQRLHLDIITPQ